MYVFYISVYCHSKPIHNFTEGEMMNIKYSHTTVAMITALCLASPGLNEAYGKIQYDAFNNLAP